MIREYQCQNEKCGHILERITFPGHKEEPAPKCPKCGSEMRKIISAGSFKMKPWH